MTCQDFDDRPKKSRRSRSVYAVAAEREALRNRTLATYAATITEQAQQIADLKRQLVASLNKNGRRT